MLFDFSLTVPNNTLQSAPFESKIFLTRGKLTQIRIFFPPGCATLVHVVVRHNLHQLVPANYDGTINADDSWIVSELEYELIDPPYEIRLIGWSPTTIYQHEITFQFNVEPVKGDTWDDFNRALLAMDIERRNGQ